MSKSDHFWQVPSPENRDSASTPVASTNAEPSHTCYKIRCDKKRDGWDYAKFVQLLQSNRSIVQPVLPRPFPSLLPIQQAVINGVHHAACGVGDPVACPALTSAVRHRARFLDNMKRHTIA